MTLTENVAKLQTLIPVLKASDASFAQSLISSFKKYGGLTAKQEPWIAKLIDKATVPAKPVFSAPVAPVQASAAHVGDFTGVIALFTTAKEHLKFPKIRLVVNGVKLTLSVTGLKSKTPGAVRIEGDGQYPYKPYFGLVSPEGVFTPSWNKQPEFTEALTKILTDLAKNPSRVAKEHGKLTGNCCFCGKVLGLGKEQRSVLVGFGPDCAEHYGLKADWLAAADKAAVKASVTPKLSVQDEVIESLQATSAPLEGLATDFAKATAAAQGLAESLAKATGASSVTVTDGPVQAEYGTSEQQAQQAYDEAADQAKNDADKEQAAAEEWGNWAADVAKAPVTYTVGTGVDTVEAHQCFFCETLSTATKTLHGYHVCPACVEQLQ